MFEKEAEEYAKEKYAIYEITGQLRNFCRIGETFKDGAEFGYNKAKKENIIIEWHDLNKDFNDLPPKINGRTFSHAVMTDNGDWACYNYDKKHWTDGLLPYPKNVHKWAYIELPKESE